MNTFQILYVALLTVISLAAWRGNGFTLRALWVNCAATLGVALAMDMAVIDRSDATLFYAVIDTATGAVLVTRVGVSRVVALLYVATVPLYVANLVFGLPIDRMFSVIYAAALAQLGAVVIGSIGTGGGGGDRHRKRAYSLASSQRGSAISARQVAKGDNVSARKGGL